MREQVLRFFDPRVIAAPRQLRLDIDHGRVGCPVRGDTDLESCFFCGYLVEVDAAGERRVVCDPPGDLERAG